MGQVAFVTTYEQINPKDVIQFYIEGKYDYVEAHKLILAACLPEDSPYCLYLETANLIEAHHQVMMMVRFKNILTNLKEPEEMEVSTKLPLGFVRPHQISTMAFGPSLKDPNIWNFCLITDYGEEQKGFCTTEAMHTFMASRQLD